MRAWLLKEGTEKELIPHIEEEEEKFKIQGILNVHIQMR